MGYYIDILDPGPDINSSLDTLWKNIDRLYREVWEKHKRKTYSDKPYQLHVNAFATMWLNRQLKVFVVYDDRTREAVGFLTGVSFRPLPYEAEVFQIQEWYTGDDKEMENALFAHVQSAIRILGCDELWVQQYIGREPQISAAWKFGGDFSIRRYTKTG